MAIVLALVLQPSAAAETATIVSAFAEKTDGHALGQTNPITFENVTWQSTGTFHVGNSLDRWAGGSVSMNVSLEPNWVPLTVADRFYNSWTPVIHRMRDPHSGYDPIPPPSEYLAARPPTFIIVNGSDGARTHQHLGPLVHETTISGFRALTAEPPGTTLVVIWCDSDACAPIEQAVRLAARTMGRIKAQSDGTQLQWLLNAYHLRTEHGAKLREGDERGAQRLAQTAVLASLWHDSELDLSFEYPALEYPAFGTQSEGDSVFKATEVYVSTVHQRGADTASLVRSEAATLLAAADREVAASEARTNQRIASGSLLVAAFGTLVAVGLTTWEVRRNQKERLQFQKQFVRALELIATMEEQKARHRPSQSQKQS